MTLLLTTCSRRWWRGIRVRDADVRNRRFISWVVGGVMRLVRTLTGTLLMRVLWV